MIPLSQSVPIVGPYKKVFIMTGSFEDVRLSLLRRGWHENPDPDSRFYDLKWALKVRRCRLNTSG